jgi:hypothetical protein
VWAIVIASPWIWAFVLAARVLLQLSSMPFRPLARIVTVVVLTAVSVSAVACSAETGDEASGSSAAAQTAKPESETCGTYPKNPACDAPFFVKKAWELANKDIVGNALTPIGEAGACLAGMAAAGAIIAGTSEVPPVAISAAAITKAVGVVAACATVAQYFHTIGLTNNLSCWFEPVVYDEGVFLCECKAACKGGRHNSGQFGDYSAARKFKFGYMDRAGSSNCYCTNDAKEVSCQWKCEKGWASTSASDCTCK